MKSKMSCSIVKALIVIVAAVVGAANAHAQAYPTKPIRMVVPWPAGGGTDIVARILVQKMGDNIGQQFVIDNRAGAAGVIGTEHTAKSAPDGYTLLMGNLATNVTNAVLFKKLSYSPVNDFVPVSLAASAPYILSVHPSLPVKTVKQLIALAKARPNEINYGTGGIGSAPHFAAALFTHLADVKMTHVPYKGGAAHTPAVVAGEVHLNFTNPLEVMPFIKVGKLRALAVTSTRRWGTVPELPTIAEAGVSGYEFTIWWGILAPLGTPAPIVARLHAETVKALHAPEVKEKFAAQGVDTLGSTPEDLGQLIRTEYVKWSKLAQDAGIKGD